MKEPTLNQHQIATGYRHVNGRPHGFEYTTRYELTYIFDTEQERQEMLDFIRTNHAE